MADQPSPDLQDHYSVLATLWDEHQSADWPVTGDAHEGELMTLDTVVAGCVTYYFEERELDDPRVEILKDCLDDLETLMSELDPDCHPYFVRLQQLGELLLKLGPVG